MTHTMSDKNILFDVELCLINDNTYSFTHTHNQYSRQNVTYHITKRFWYDRLMKEEDKFYDYKGNIAGWWGFLNLRSNMMTYEYNSQIIN